MNIDYTVTALMFPAIPLTMSIYSNRFHTLSSLIRKLHDEYIFEKHIPSQWEKQLLNLNGRIKLLRYSIVFASFGFLFNMLTVFGLYLNRIFEARIIFGSCCVAMIISIIFFLREIQLSTKALKLHLSDMKIDLLKNLNEISIVDFDHTDVVRHPLVTKIVKAYDDFKDD